jgi:hypothetical protein
MFSEGRVQKPVARRARCPIFKTKTMALCPREGSPATIVKKIGLHTGRKTIAN